MEYSSAWTPIGFVGNREKDKTTFMRFSRYEYEDLAEARIILVVLQLAMHVWKQLFFEQSSQSLTETCFQLIRRERNGERINGLRIKNVVLSYGTGRSLGNAHLSIVF